MQLNTKKQVKKLELAIAKQHNIDSVAEKFNVSPSAAQKMIEAAQTNNDFYSRINVITVVNQKGEAIRVGVTGMIGSTTDTDAEDRTPMDALSLGGTPYLCEQINFDTFMKYATLDAWAHQKNFKTLVANQTRKNIVSTQIMIGFFGESRAAKSDPVANPKGQDVAKGWLTKLEEQAPEQVLVEGANVGEIRIGTGGDYLNLDAAVNDVKQAIDDPFIEDEDLVAIIGSELLAADKAKFYDEHGNTPSEKARIEDRQVIGTYGGLPAYRVPNFPSRGILVTSFKNLSIYIQQDSVRRLMLDNPKRDRYENYQSQDMDYVIEELGKAAAVKHANVKLPAGAGWA